MPVETPALTPDQLLEHWLGHRRLTRRMIEAFPERELFSYSIGGMRPFASLAQEMLGMAIPVVRGVATGAWEYTPAPAAGTRAALLVAWDSTTEELVKLWATIPPARFQKHDVAFGQWPGPGYQIILYAIDNEVHHRGQGYVYLRALGVEPPPFPVRD